MHLPILDEHGEPRARAKDESSLDTVMRSSSAGLRAYNETSRARQGVLLT